MNTNSLKKTLVVLKNSFRFWDTKNLNKFFRALIFTRGVKN
jgi:hypothetical protein